MTRMFEVLHFVRRGMLIFEAATEDLELSASFVEITSPREMGDCYFVLKDPHRRSTLFTWWLNFPLTGKGKLMTKVCQGTIGPRNITSMMSFSRTVSNLYHLQEVLYQISLDSELSPGLFLEVLDGFIGRLAISNETSVSVFPSNLLGCQFSYVPWGSSIAETSAHLIVSLLNLLVAFTACGPTLITSVDITTIITTASDHLSQTLAHDRCLQNLVSSIIPHFWTTAGIPPTIDDCLRSSNALIVHSLPLVTGIDNKVSLNATTHVITVNPFYGNSTLSMINSSQCLSTTTVPQIDCDELSNSQCGSYGGCFVLWGPCQTVTDGFFSPSGILNQIPCPRGLGPHEQYISSSAQIFCQSYCYPVGLFYRASDGTCLPVPVGYMVDPCNERNLISCGFEHSIGITPIELSTTCLGRPIGTGIGSASIVQDSPPLSIETWVRLNTKLVTQDLALLGVIGYLAVGIRHISDSKFSLFFYGNQLTGTGLLLSDSVLHLDGSQWVHIAVVVYSECTFYINGDIVGQVALTPGPSVSFPNIIRSELASTLTSLIGQIHYGPVKFLASDFITSSVIPDFLLFDKSETVSPEFQLFNPRVIDMELTQLSLGFFGLIPPGFPRPAGSVNASEILGDLPVKLSWLGCENFCYSNITHCVDSCGNKIFNPYTCECETRPTAHAIATTSTSPSSTMSLQVTTSITSEHLPTIAEDRTVLIIIIISVVTVISLCSWWIIRKRRVAKIGQVKRRNSTMDPFTDITAMYFSSN